MKTQIVSDIRQSLINSIDPKALASSQRFHKPGEAPKVHGVRMGDVSKIAKEGLKEIKNLPKQIIFELCEELWQCGYLEESVVACIWAESLHKQYEPADFNVFEWWVHNYLTNWADCDTLCNHTIGNFIMMYPQYVAELKKWAVSPLRFVRRAAAVTLIIPARKGLFLNDIFEIADILLLDKDDLVQKGYGWMLKAASEAHCEEVFDYVMSKKMMMPRTAFRYAIEKMPADLKVKAMEKIDTVKKQTQKPAVRKSSVSSAIDTRKLVPVDNNGKWGFVDASTGEEVVPFIYDYTHPFSVGLALVRLNDWWGYVDKTGKEVIPCIYNPAYSFTKTGLAAVCIEGKYGFIDQTGKEVIPFIYDEARYFSKEGKAKVKLNGETFFIDVNGNRIL